MKMKMKKMCALLLSAAMLSSVLLAGCGAQSGSSSSSSMTAAEVTEYVSKAADKTTVTVYFENGQKDIPFLEVNDVAALLNDLGKRNGDTKMKFSVTDNKGVVTLTRETGAKVELDFNDKVLRYYDFDGLFRRSFATTAIDVVTQTGYDASGRPVYISRENMNNFERKGSPIGVNLGKDGIPMVYENGKGYIPLQTVSDMFVSQFDTSILYNGKDVFIARGELGDLQDIYYSVPTGQRSEALAKFSYNELIVALNMFYSLKDSHNIDNFSDFFEQTGLDEKLQSTDPVVVDKAIYSLCSGYFGDGHSGFGCSSAYAGKDAIKKDKSDYSTSLANYLNLRDLYKNSRAQAYPNGIPGYEEVGDTAFVTFDEFNSLSKDYYTTPATASDSETFGLIQYAHSQIMREGSPVKNVVLDLSCNGGGDLDAAVYTIGWFLGNCTISINDTLTGAKASTQYKVDVNGDRQFDDKDSISSKNLYCLISPLSFSCGNLVPAMFKFSGRVTLLGKQSSGGTGAVQPLSTADGTMLQISGSKSISTVSNGAFYDVDSGVEPDFIISKPADFYNRAALAKYISGLY